MNMQLIESANGFVLTYETWFRYLALVFGLFFAAAAPFSKQGRARILAIAGIGIMLGIYPLTYKAQLTPEAGSVYGFIRYDTHVSWADVTSARLQRGYKGKTLIIAETGGEAFEMEVSGLSDPQRQRVLAYIEEQVAAAAR